MGERLTGPIGFWNQNFPNVQHAGVLPDQVPLHKANGSFAASDEMKRDFSRAALFAPILKIRCDSEWSIAGDKLKN
jgi:hypothetical protein